MIAGFKEEERSVPALGGFDGLVDGPSVFHVFEEARLQVLPSVSEVQRCAIIPLGWMRITYLH